jgi:hypothetical protein
VKQRRGCKKEAKEANNKSSCGQVTDNLLKTDDLNGICGMGKIYKRESIGCGIVQQQADDEYEYAKKPIVADGAGGHGYEKYGKYRMLWVVVLSGVCPDKGIFRLP